MPKLHSGPQEVRHRVPHCDGSERPELHLVTLLTNLLSSATTLSWQARGANTRSGSGDGEASRGCGSQDDGPPPSLGRATLTGLTGLRHATGPLTAPADEAGDSEPQDRGALEGNTLQEGVAGPGVVTGAEKGNHQGVLELGAGTEVTRFMPLKPWQGGPPRGVPTPPFPSDGGSFRARGGCRPRQGKLRQHDAVLREHRDPGLFGRNAWAAGSHISMAHSVSEMPAWWNPSGHPPQPEHASRSEASEV